MIRRINRNGASQVQLVIHLFGLLNSFRTISRQEASVKILILGVAFAIAVVVSGCGAKGDGNVTATNQNSAPSNSNVQAPAPAAPTNEMDTAGSTGTPSDVYRAAYELREKKDLAGLKKIMSKDVLEFLTMVAEEEKSTLDREIAKIFEKPQAKTVETRNEMVRGDRAALEYLDEDGEWKTMDFIKEDGAWKLALPHVDSPDPSSSEKKAP